MTSISGKNDIPPKKRKRSEYDSEGKGKGKGKGKDKGKEPANKQSTFYDSAKLDESILDQSFANSQNIHHTDKKIKKCYNYNKNKIPVDLPIQLRIDKTQLFIILCRTIYNSGLQLIQILLTYCHYVYGGIDIDQVLFDGNNIIHVIASSNKYTYKQVEQIFYLIKYYSLKKYNKNIIDDCLFKSNFSGKNPFEVAICYNNNNFINVLQKYDFKKNNSSTILPISLNERNLSTVIVILFLYTKSNVMKILYSDFNKLFKINHFRFTYLSNNNKSIWDFLIRGCYTNPDTYYNSTEINDKFIYDGLILSDLYYDLPNKFDFILQYFNNDLDKLFLCFFTQSKCKQKYTIFDYLLYIEMYEFVYKIIYLYIKAIVSKKVIFNNELISNIYDKKSYEEMRTEILSKYHIKYTDIGKIE
jgi:hypothetical protein